MARALSTHAGARKRAVNLTMNESLAAQARTYISNLSATMEELLAGYVAQQQVTRLGRLRIAHEASTEWNAVHASVGSFTDEHSTL